MEQNSDAMGRLWRRAAGLGAFALFFATFLLALGLGQLALLVGSVALVGAFAGSAAWLLIRHRDVLDRGLRATWRRVAPGAARAAGGATALGHWSAAWSARAGKAGVIAAAGGSRACIRGARRAARQAGPAARRARVWVVTVGARTKRRTRAGIDAALPVVRGAQQGATAQLRAAGAAGTRQAARAAAVVAADVAAHRERARDARARTEPARARQRPPTHRHSESLPTTRSVGWDGEPTAEHALDTHDEIEPTARRKSPARR